jgi:uncharacterized protein Yka (UPF0111/DUF47 family)
VPLRRSAHDSAFFSLLVTQTEHLRDANLVLAELSGIPAAERRQAVKRMHSISDRADESAGAMLRLLRENYLPPLDRRELYALSDTIRDVNHRLDAVGFAMTSSAFDDLPVGVLEMLSLLSQQADQTIRMAQRLGAKVDQWDYVDRMNSLHNRAIALQQQVSDAVPAARLGLTYLAAAMSLSNAFIQASSGCKAIARVVAEIAIRES